MFPRQINYLLQNFFRIKGPSNAQIKNIPNVSIDDIYTGNGVSELINLCMSALLDDGDEVLIPSPDYPLWTGDACWTTCLGPRYNLWHNFYFRSKSSSQCDIRQPYEIWTIKFALDLLRDKKILLIHGGGFNWQQPDHFRVV
mgnify:CR=1 FL=1